MFLLGLTWIDNPKNFTGAIKIVDFTVDSLELDDSIYVYLPLAETTITANYFGDTDTSIKITYPWPSVFDQNSYEWISDSLGVASIHTYDRWAMEDWAFAFYIEDLNGAGVDVDSVTIDIQYSHIPATAWTIPYNLITNQDSDAYLHTFYPFDLFDNWKLYRHSRLNIVVVSDSVRIQGWLVFRQMYFHENVRPGE